MSVCHATVEIVDQTVFGVGRLDPRTFDATDVLDAAAAVFSVLLVAVVGAVVA